MEISELWDLQGKIVIFDDQEYLVGATEFIRRDGSELKILALWTPENWAAEEPWDFWVSSEDSPDDDELMRYPHVRVGFLN